MRLQGAMLFVKDLPQMAAFYMDVLGLKPIAETRMENFMEFDSGGPRFALHAIPREIADGIQIASPPRPREKNPVRRDFEVADANQERSRLEALGVTVLVRP